ncbi:MAG: hypothetical protein M3067_15780 [Chloroflexota bacterium]|nr:hypothetical protein [Chloroflexota bacterium]
MSDAHAAPHGSGASPGGADGAIVHEHLGEHEVEPLGPVDTQAWGAGLLGIALGLVVALGFVFATAAVQP